MIGFFDWLYLRHVLHRVGKRGGFYVEDWKSLLIIVYFIRGLLEQVQEENRWLIIEIKGIEGTIFFKYRERVRIQFVEYIGGLAVKVLFVSLFPEAK